MFGFFGGKKDDKPKASPGKNRRSTRLKQQSDAAKKRTSDRKTALAERRKKASAAATERKKKVAARSAELKKRRADKAKPKAKAKPKVEDKSTQKKSSVSGKTASYTNTNRRAQASSKETGGVKTKAGNYPVYKKNSGAAKSFRTAFADAKKSGMKVFTWEGKKYNTKTK
jgi:hypothetical protein